MTDHSRVSQLVELAYEPVEGTAQTPNRKLPALDIREDMDAVFNLYRPTGNKYNTIAILGKEWTVAKYSGPLTFGEIVYALSSIIQNSSTASTTAGITKWVFTPNSSLSDTSASYTLEWGDATSSYRAVGQYFGELEIKLSRTAAEISGTLMGRRLQVNSGGITTITNINETTTTAVTGGTTNVQILVTTDATTRFYASQPLLAYNADGTLQEVITIKSVDDTTHITINAFFFSHPSGWNISNMGGYVENVPVPPPNLDLFFGTTFASVDTLAAAPAAPTLSAGVSGTIAAGLWTVKVAYRYPNGSTLPSAQAQFTTTSGQSVRVAAITPPAGVTVDYYMSPAVADPLVRYTYNGTGAQVDLGTAAIPAPAATADITPVYGVAVAATRISRGFDASVKISKRFAPFWTIDSTQTSFAGRVEDVPDATLSLKIGEDSTGTDFVTPLTLAKMRAGATTYLRFQGFGNNPDPRAQSSDAYLFAITMSVKVVKPLKFEDVDGALLGLSWECQIVHDSTAGKAISFYVINATPSL